MTLVLGVDLWRLNEKWVKTANVTLALLNYNFFTQRKLLYRSLLDNIENGNLKKIGIIKCRV
jgi:hypothetical protein